MHVHRAVRERVVFLRSFVANPRQVGAVLPTSRTAVRAMLDLADLSSARVVAELGAGTGVYTEEILARLGAEARLLAFELDPALAEALRARVQDPRLEVVVDSAEKLAEYLGGERADVIVSGLPFTSLPAAVRRGVLDAATAGVATAGALLVLQYSPFIERELRRRFTGVRRRVCLLNVPPAWLYACTGARAAQ